MAREPSWLEAITTVLREAGRALHYVTISERIVGQRLKARVGANPAATVGAIISRSLSSPDSPLQRVGAGEYALKETLHQDEEDEVRRGTLAEAELEPGTLRAFGMYWQRDLAIWTGKPLTPPPAYLASGSISPCSLRYAVTRS